VIHAGARFLRGGRVDLLGLAGYRNAPAGGGPVIHAVDLIFGDRDLFVLDDQDEPLVGGFVELARDGLGGASLEHTNFGTALEFLDLGPRIVGRKRRGGGE